jgi:acetyltransferase-like isoleucine patch superfamily enzyme
MREGRFSRSVDSAMRNMIFFILRLFQQPGFLLRNCQVALTSRIERGSFLVNSSVGPYSYIGGGTYLNAVHVGNYCSIASGVKIGGMEHSWWWGSTSPRLSDHNISDRQTIIEDDVWIGANVVIRQGLRIGRGAVLGAGSVVLSDVDSYVIVAGVPAKVIRRRFSEDVVSQVVATKFWNYPPNKAKMLLNAIKFPETSGQSTSSNYVCSQ